VWWEDAVIYQVYPRSFQDGDGDGVGDLRGIARRLDHIAQLGAGALWLSPTYPSPMADFGYDVADFRAVDPVFGTLEDLDALVAAAHERDLRVLMDLVPCHTSIEHPWFRERPDFYFVRDTPERPNNWLATFGGPAWSRDPYGRGWYLHSFYPEQPDLNWRNPAVVEAMQDVVRFWLDRGVDGFRLDALDRLLKDADLRDDPPASGPPPLPLWPEHATLEHLHSRDAEDIGTAVEALRDAAGDKLLVGEVYVPTADLGRYLEHLDFCFCFELFQAPWDAGALRAAIEAATAPTLTTGKLAWVLSNHDFPRLPDRVGEANVRAAILLLLTLPGLAFLYQGDEIGMPDGPGHEPPYDRAGRDRHRHPMQWDATATGGFTTGVPWLPLIDPERRNVAGEDRDPASLLTFVRRVVEARRQLTGELRFLETEDEDVIAYARAEHAVALNLSGEPRRPPVSGGVVVATHPDVSGGALPPHGGGLFHRT
jgi:alpha-glucosidase